MKGLKGREIRQLFLDYFARQGHKIVPSAPLVPADDPTLLFTNAGMVQFKKVFLGQEIRSYRRATSCQKCVRAGGKHNDLENVGYTARHHTFFEMLGNFSFGDYFKEEAIVYAWEFLVKELDLPKQKLYVTIFKDDDEAERLWKKVSGLPSSRIIRLGEKDNFWAMGDTGPCGPCSEIIYDQGPEVGCGQENCRVGCDCDRYLELWNLVFMQYDKGEDGVLRPLPHPCIDTGMGLERITATLQGVKTNFDTDLFSALMEEISRLSGKPYREGQEAVAFRVIADHARAAAFLLADGVLPSNEGRGYVLRRIIRRAIRFGRALGIKDIFFYKVALVVEKDMHEVYPELTKAVSTIEKILRLEEERFQETLERGLSLLKEEFQKMQDKDLKVVPGSFLFKLYDTYGFPYDIVRDLALERGFSLDMAGFQREMERQRAQSRRHWKGEMTRCPEAFRKLLAQGIEQRFIGYDSLEASAKVISIVAQDEELEELSSRMEGQVVFSQTPFYAEAGGQVGDRGELSSSTCRGKILDTYKIGELIVHKVKIEQGILKLADEVYLKVDPLHRQAVACHHTATHLLHAALREILGEHVRQAGSLVAPERLRFDFTHFEALTWEKIEALENLVNKKIRENLLVKTEILSLQEALEKGAMALFGEKYGEEVRVVEIDSFSLELCGGTHVKRTGDIGFFKIVSEGSVSAGVRRIEAVAGKSAIDFIHRREKEWLNLAAKLKVSLSEVPSRVYFLLQQLKEQQQEIEALRRQITKGGLEKLLEQKKEYKGVNILASQVEARDAKTLREIGDYLKEKLGSGVIVLAAPSKEKVNLLVMVTRDLSSRLHAGKIIQELAAILEGMGGGRPEMAQGGGKRVDLVPKALNAVQDIIKGFLS